MKQTLLKPAFAFFITLSLSATSLFAQSGSEAKTDQNLTTGDELSATTGNGTPGVGKEVPVPGGVLFVTPAERASMQKEVSVKKAESNREKRRQRRLKKQDRKEVTDVIGDSVHNYLDNATTVNTLQRF